MMEQIKKYTWGAEDYAANSSFQFGLAKELISKLSLTGSENVLDIGCGDGKITAEIAQHVSGGSILGIDSSEKMISLARNSYGPEKYPNLSFEIMDAREIILPNKFDVVFSNAALHWIRGHFPVLKGIWNCLNPGGKILLQMGGKGNAASIIGVIDEMMNNNKWNEFFKVFEFPYGFYSDKIYNSWLKESGFENRRVELIPKDMVYPDKKGLAAWIRTTWLPYLERIPTNLHEEFIDELINIYCTKNPPDNEAKIHVAMMRLEVEAYKPN